MPDYSILITKTAQKQLDKLPTTIAENLITAIKALAKNQRPNGYKRLKGGEGYRIRKGDYCILYDIYK